MYEHFVFIQLGSITLGQYDMRMHTLYNGSRRVPAAVGNRHINPYLLPIVGARHLHCARLHQRLCLCNHFLRKIGKDSHFSFGMLQNRPNGGSHVSAGLPAGTGNAYMHRIFDHVVACSNLNEAHIALQTPGCNSCTKCDTDRLGASKRRLYFLIEQLGIHRIIFSNRLHHAILSAVRLFIGCFYVIIFERC